MRYHYAAEYPYGMIGDRERKELIRIIRRFTSASDRDAWAENGGPRRYDPGWREAVDAHQITRHEREDMREHDGQHVRPQRSDADTLRAAYTACGRSQDRFAADILGVSRSGFTGWLAGQACPAPTVRLCWSIIERPALADEIERHFNP